MHRLLIASRDGNAYKEHIYQQNLPSLEVVQSIDTIQNADPRGKATILLGDPDLCAQVLNHQSGENIDWVQSTWAGIKPILDTQKTAIKVTGVKGIFGPQMREYVFAYVLHFSRKVEEFRMLQQQHKWSQPKTDSIYGKTIGILGLGSIGMEVAHTAKHFGMQVVGVSRQTNNSPSIDQHYTLQQFSEFAPQLDYLVSLLPHTKETEKVIGKSFISALKPSCILINAGRAQSIDDDALLDALQNQRLKGAVLDVFEQEPLSSSSPLWQMPNVIVTQHTAAVSGVSDITKIFIENYHRYIKNQYLKFQTDWQLGY